MSIADMIEQGTLDWDKSGMHMLDTDPDTGAKRIFRCVADESGTSYTQRFDPATGEYDTNVETMPRDQLREDRYQFLKAGGAKPDLYLNTEGLVK